MPLYMDRHEIGEASAEETARNHAADLQVAGRHDVEFFSYWHDSDRGLVFCFARAPEANAVARAHSEAHGSVPAEIIEVSEGDVVRFLGMVQDPADASEATSAFRLLGFTDLVGSTGLLDGLGQATYMNLLAEHDLAIRDALLRWRGREVKHTGDGFMVVFDVVDSALDWALEVRAIFARHPVLDIRVGLAAGEPVDHDRDLFGAVVTTANRICSAAGSNQVFVSDLITQITTRFVFEDRGLRELKGFSDPMRLYELVGARRRAHDSTR